MVIFSYMHMIYFGPTYSLMPSENPFLPSTLPCSTPGTVLVPIVPLSFQSLDITYREKCAEFIYRFYIILFNLTIFNFSHFSANDIFFIFMAK